MLKIMPGRRTDIYAVPVSGDYLVHAPLQRVTALVNSRALDLLEDSFQKGGAGAPEQPRLKELMDRLRGPVVDMPCGPTGSIQPGFLGILPTLTCNLSCVYCDFGAVHAPRDRMDLRMAVDGVDWMAETMRCLGRDSLEIHFFGGEPFVAGEVVDVVVHRARSVASQLGLVPRFEVCTNGVFDEARARFVGDHIDTVVLSMDGCREMHDRNRPTAGGKGSFEQVASTAHLLSQSSADLCFRTCVTQDNVSQLEQVTEYFCETFRPAMVDFEPLRSTDESEAMGLTPPNPYDFAVHYIRAGRVAESFCVKPVFASVATDVPRTSFCPVGRDVVILRPNGRVSGCYLPEREWEKRNLDLHMGRYSSDESIQIDPDALNRLRRLAAEKPRCERCFCRWTCAGGCHVVHTYPGCSLDYDDFCIQTRIITACLLLSDLGLEEKVDELLEDRTAMENLAFHPADCIASMAGSNVDIRTY